MLAAYLVLILLLTGLATAGALVLFLAPVTMMKTLLGQTPFDAAGDIQVFLRKTWMSPAAPAVQPMATRWPRGC
jgi:hypothetical protein